MAIHLFIVGQENPFLNPFRTAFERAIEVDKEFFKRTCSSRSQLLGIVREVVIVTGQRIDLLDIFDHGSEGVQKLAGEKLFSASEPPDPEAPLKTGTEIAHGLRRFLTIDARVRLLGCNTALGDSGKALLLSLQRELGEARVVFGTNGYANAGPLPPPDIDIDDSEFGARGFRDVREDSWLFSSTEARMGLDPTYDARKLENKKWIEEIRRG